MRRVRWAVAVGLLSTAPRMLAAQYLELFEPAAKPYHVGDTLVFKVKLTGVEQMSPVDPAPKLAQPLPAGVHLVRADSMRRITNGHYESQIVFQFFRAGVQNVPQLVQRVRNLGADPGRNIVANVDPIEIVATIPDAGEPRPEDIRPPVPVGPPAWPVLVGGGALMLVAAWLLRRWRRVRAHATPAPVATMPRISPLDARSAALKRFAELESAGFARQGDVARHYGETVDVLRDFLHAIRQSPRARAGTDELLLALARAAGIPAHAAPLLVEADFVKFAAVRPDADSAERFLSGARTVVERWEANDAVR